MAIASYSKYFMYKQPIQSLPSISEENILSEQFLLEKDEKKQLEIYYAPFEYVNEQAKVVIVGITPGLNQMKKSYSTVFNAKNSENNDEEILCKVKNNSSFEGSMRKNLIHMLDELGLNKHLGISSTANLFDEAWDLVHTTSVITYPVFHKGKNYAGTTPNMLKTEILKKHITNRFATELNGLNKPLIIPLGTNVSKIFEYLVEKEIIDPKLILTGFPHPSGANGSRKKQFESNEKQMKEKIKTHFQGKFIV
jgi:hypothetical protein